MGDCFSRLRFSWEFFASLNSTRDLSALPREILKSAGPGQYPKRGTQEGSTACGRFLNGLALLVLKGKRCALTGHVENRVGCFRVLIEYVNSLGSSAARRARPCGARLRASPPSSLAIGRMHRCR